MMQRLYLDQLVAWWQNIIFIYIKKGDIVNIGGNQFIIEEII